jgi:hypothetical protein
VTVVLSTSPRSGTRSSTSARADAVVSVTPEFDHCVPLSAQLLNDEDEVVPDTGLEAGGTAMLDGSARLTGALRQLRTAA